MWKNMAVTQVADHKVTRRMHFHVGEIRLRKKHSEYVALIAIPRQQELRERASLYVICALLVLLWFKPVGLA
jgi:hypothetical protein